MSVYYNEIDPYCAQWLQNLMAASQIPHGVIDTRSIEDVRPDELVGFTQCHFFAGLGGWPYALQLAGWGTRPVWTGSCPCQPFSAAGKGAGFADERHLWPAWQHLINQCRPAVVFGEQVASKAVDPWIDLVHADVEGMGYAFGCVPFPSAGVGAPHPRERSYWVGVGLADANHARLEGRQLSAERAAEFVTWSGGVAGRMGNTHRAGSQPGQLAATSAGHEGSSVADGRVRGLADSNILAGGQGCAIGGRRHSGGDAQPRPGLGGSGMPHSNAAGPINGFWRAADWLSCTDGKWRPVEPGTFPLAHGATSRVGRLRAYGNAIVPQAAAEFILAFLDIEDAQSVA